MLFLIFINDLSELIQNQASFFADDTTLHTTDKSLVRVVSALAVILTEQPIGLTGGVCSSAPQRASIFPLDGTAESICVHERGSYPAGSDTQAPWVYFLQHTYMEWPYFEPWYYMCSDDRNSATPWWKHSIIVYEKKLYSCYSPLPRICLRGMEWRTGSKTATLTRLIFEKTWNNASSPPEENVFKVQSFVKSLPMPIESLLTTIFFSRDETLTFNTHKTLVTKVSQIFRSRNCFFQTSTGPTAIAFLQRRRPTGKEELTMSSRLAGWSSSLC